MGDVYDPGRRCSRCGVGTYHTTPVYLYGLLLLASFSIVSSAKPVRYNPPRFLDTANNSTAVVGSDVVLQCSVAHLGTKSVVWKKKTQSNPLTVGNYVFAPGSRYDVIRTDPYMSQDQYNHRQSEVNPRWNLRISNVQMEDAGLYECQISTKEDIVRVVTLHVVEDKSRRQNTPKTGIQLKGTAYVEKGSTIDLNCTARGMDYRIESVDWFRDGNRIKSGHRTQIRIYSDTNTLRSRLEVKRATMSDAGTYVCRTSQSHVQSIKVMVLNTDSSNKRRGTDHEGIAHSLGPQNPQPSQTSHPRGRHVNVYHQQQPEDRQGGTGSASHHHPTSHLHTWCLLLLLLAITHICRTAT